MLRPLQGLWLLASLQHKLLLLVAVCAHPMLSAVL
jgi:hypothetical protein